MTTRVQAGIPSGGQFAATPHTEADISLDLSASIDGPLEAFLCESCEEISSDVGEAVYECSRCGNSQVDDRRCSACHVFMAKVSDESCEVCEAPGPLTSTSAFEVDGRLFPTSQEAEEWVADAPNRAERQAKSEAELNELLSERAVEVAARAEALRPRIEAVLALISPQTAPEMHSAITASIESFESPFVSFFLVPVRMREVLDVRFPGEFADDYEIAADYDRDWDERVAAAARIRDGVLAQVQVSETFVDRLHSWSPGSAPRVEIEDALDLLLGDRH